jgi:hypothetical protein
MEATLSITQKRCPYSFGKLNYQLYLCEQGHRVSTNCGGPCMHPLHGPRHAGSSFRETEPQIDEKFVSQTKF